MYGLIGKTLAHSFSKKIHEKLGKYKYNYIELNEDELDKFMIKKNFTGINVTIPYKERVVKYLNKLDDVVKRIGAVNTIVNNNGMLIGYNTDYFGFKYLLLNNNIVVKEKFAVILGTGGTSKTVSYVLKDLGVGRIIYVSRNPSKDNEIGYEDLSLAKNAQVLINTTPIGMYPNTHALPCDLDLFPNLETVVDVVFNPIQTALIVEAKHRGIQSVGGLSMLVAQAIYSCELFTNTKIDKKSVQNISSQLLKDESNIVFIGMPYAGKTTIGKRVAAILKKDFVDIDQVISTRENMSIPDIFSSKGEAYFRALEKEIIAEYSSKHSLVIATGGGAVLDNDNIKALRQNGFIIFLNRPVELMHPDQNRPLVKQKEDLEKLEKERINLYKNACDVEIKNDTSVKVLLERITSGINEYFNR